MKNTSKNELLNFTKKQNQPLRKRQINLIAELLEDRTALSLSPVTGFQFRTADPTNINLTWDNVAGATTYEISRSNDGSNYYKIGNSAVPVFADDNASENAVNYYKVTARSAADSSPESQPIFTTINLRTSLPGGWKQQDVGKVPASGNAAFSNGTFSIQSAGLDIGGSQDSFHYAFQQLNGDGSIIAKISSTDFSDPTAKAGLMLRDDLNPESTNVAITFSPSSGINFQYPSTANGETNYLTTTADTEARWVKLTRNGNLITGSYSTDSINWTQAGSVSLSLNHTLKIGLASTSNNPTKLSNTSFTDVSILQGAETFEPWTNQDIGVPGIAGRSTFDATSGTYTISGNGIDIQNESDQFQYEYQQLTGNGSIVAQITSLKNTNGWAKAGVMIRSDLTSGSINAIMALTPSHGVDFQYRSVAGGPTKALTSYSASAPEWVKITRVDNTITGYFSKDGITWKTAGSTTLNTSATAYIGLAVTSTNTSAISTATFKNVTVTNGNLPGLTNTDIGSPTIAGTSAFNPTLNTLTLGGGGNGIEGAADQFNFNYQKMTGDGSLTVKVKSVDNTNPWAKVGLMIRNDLSAGSMNAFMAIDPSNEVGFQYRSVTGDSTITAGTIPLNSAIWLKVTRSGNTITGYYSIDGTNWITGGSTELNLSDTAFVGLGVSSYTISAKCNAVFEKFAVSQGPSANVWSNNDIGSPTVQGSTNINSDGDFNVTFNLSGGGSDINNDSAEFNFENQKITGDGSIIAQVKSFTNTGELAKAGVMIRGDLSSASANAYIFVTPTNSINFQYRTSSGSQTISVTPIMSINPKWIKLSRSGNTVIGSYSSDGVIWNQLGSASINFDNVVYAGLAATSANASALCNVSFSNVSVSELIAPGWSYSDVGSPTIPGTSAYRTNRDSEGTVTIAGAGNDIYLKSDQFNYYYQTLTGDGSIVAHVSSQTNTDPWAKAGVMIRNNLSPDSIHAIMCVTPRNGFAFQWRPTTADDSLGTSKNPKNSASWVKITRIGNTLSGYYSTDGVNWNFCGQMTANESLNNTVLIGLANCSHSSSIGASEFDNVSISHDSPGTPTNLSVSQTSANQLTLHWDAPSGNVSGYYVYRFTNSLDVTYLEHPAPLNANPIIGTSFEDTTADASRAGYSYYYKVQAIYNDTFGELSAGTEFSTPLQGEERGTWIPTNIPMARYMLMGDGKLMSSLDGGAVITPDKNGRYTSGIISSVPSSIYSHVFASTQVLQNGKLFVAGGEYGNGGREAELYDPIKNTWSSIPHPDMGNLVDSNSVMLPNGTIMIAPVYPSEAFAGGIIIYDPKTNSFSSGPPVINAQDEHGWAQLPDGSILDPNDTFAKLSQRYIPSLGRWIEDAPVPAPLFFGGEEGSMQSLPNGKVIVFGGTGYTAIYTPSGTLNPGTWEVGPQIPWGYNAADTTSVTLADGNILCVFGYGYLPNSTRMAVYNYQTNSFQAVPTAPTSTSSAYGITSLALPDGGALFTNMTGGTGVYEFKPKNGPSKVWLPIIKGVSKNGDGSYTLRGTRLTGYSQGATYGDDFQMSTNYPMVQLTSSAGVVTYARSFNWSSTQINTGSTPQSTHFQLPRGLAAGTYSLRVITNSIASDPYRFVLAKATPAVVKTAASLNSSLTKVVTFAAGTADLAPPSNAGISIDTQQNVVTGDFSSQHLGGKRDLSSDPQTLRDQSDDSRIRQSSVTYQTSSNLFHLNFNLRKQLRKSEHDLLRFVPNIIRRPIHAAEETATEIFHVESA